MDNVFFILSKFLWFIIRPENILILLLALTAFLFVINKNRLAKKLFVFNSSIIFLFAFFPVGSWLMYPLETHFSVNPKLPNKVDGIILLGGSFVTSNSQAWGKVQTNQFADRIHVFLKLLNQYPNAKAVFTGGNASVTNKNPGEAFYAKKLFDDIGIKEGKILFENKARNTYENAFLTKQLIQPQKDENWIVVSSAFHLPRSVGVFCKQNWSIIPYPADFHSNPDELLTPSLNFSGNLNSLNDAIHEWLGLIAYHWTGKSTAILPEKC